MALRGHANKAPVRRPRPPPARNGRSKLVVVSGLGNAGELSQRRTPPRGGLAWHKARGNPARGVPGRAGRGANAAAEVLGFDVGCPNSTTCSPPRESWSASRLSCPPATPFWGRGLDGVCLVFALGERHEPERELWPGVFCYDSAPYGAYPLMAG
jgi:hypothetical protein